MYQKNNHLFQILPWTLSAIDKRIHSFFYQFPFRFVACILFPLKWWKNNEYWSCLSHARHFAHSITFIIQNLTFFFFNVTYEFLCMFQYIHRVEHSVTKFIHKWYGMDTHIFLVVVVVVVVVVHICMLVDTQATVYAFLLVDNALLVILLSPPNRLTFRCHSLLLLFVLYIFFCVGRILFNMISVIWRHHAHTNTIRQSFRGDDLFAFVWAWHTYKNAVSKCGIGIKNCLYIWNAIRFY